MYNCIVYIIMASTSNKNTPGNYSHEQKMNKQVDEYRTFVNSAAGHAYTNHLPGNGLLPASNARDNLCKNYCDIESQLRGIGSTNLVNPQPPVKPQLKTIPTQSFFQRTPMIMPKPLVMEHNQRPFPIPE